MKFNFLRKMSTLKLILWPYQQLGTAWFPIYKANRWLINTPVATYVSRANLMRTRVLLPTYFRGWYYDPQGRLIGNKVENLKWEKTIGRLLIEAIVCLPDPLASSSPEEFCCLIAFDWSILQTCRLQRTGRNRDDCLQKDKWVCLAAVQLISPIYYQNFKYLLGKMFGGCFA